MDQNVLIQMQQRVAAQTGQVVPLADIETLLSNPQALNAANSYYVEGAGRLNDLPTDLKTVPAPAPYRWYDQFGNPVGQTFATAEEAERNKPILMGDSAAVPTSVKQDEAHQAKWQFTPESQAKLAHFNHLSSNNFTAEIDPNTGEFAGFRIKTGDKQGTIIPYTKQEDGSYAVNYDGQQDVKWNTTNRKYGLMVVGAIAAAAAAAAAGAFGAAGQSALGMGTTAAEGAAAAGTAAGNAGLFESAYGAAALDGSAGAITAPASTWGATGAAYVPGTSAAAGFTPGAGIVAGEGGAATLGSTAAALSGSLPSTIVDAVNTAVNTGQTLETVLAASGIPISAVQEAVAAATPGSSLWDSIQQYIRETTAGIGTPGAIPGAGGVGDWLNNNSSGLLQTIIGAIGADRGEDATDKLLAERVKHAEDFKSAGLDYSDGLLGLLDKYGDAYKPQYATADNGFATSNVDPVTGKVSATLNAPFQGLLNQYTTGASNLLDQVNAYSTPDAAKKYFSDQQALLAAGDAKAEQGLLQSLYAKGGYGLSLNTPAAAMTPDGSSVVAGSGSVAVNPYVDTFLNAKNARDAGIAATATDKAQSYLASLIQQGNSLTNQASGIQRDANGALTMAGDWSNRFNTDRRTEADFGVNLEGRALAGTRDATQDYIRSVLGANERAIGSDAASQAGLIEALLRASRSGNGTGGGWLTNLPWSDVTSWLGSLGR